MNINSNKPPENQPASRVSPNVQKTPDAEARDSRVGQARNAAPADKVEISGKSREIADLMSAVNSLPDVREARVREIQQSVEAGAYAIDPQKVAEKIISEIV